MLRFIAMTLGLILLAGCQRQPPAEVDLDLESRRGQWVVINYWAQWCKPCIHEIPELNALDREYVEVTVLGVNYDQLSGEALAEQVGALGITFPTLTSDPSPALAIERPMVLPTTVIVTPQGQLHASLIGPQTLASLVAAIGESLAPR